MMIVDRLMYSLSFDSKVIKITFTINSHNSLAYMFNRKEEET